jgi:hypothetical protein
VDAPQKLIPFPPPNPELDKPTQTMDALNFLLETTENLNDGSAKMNDGLYLDMMNKLKDLHKVVSQSAPQPHIIHPPPPRPRLPLEILLDDGVMLANRMSDIINVSPTSLQQHWCSRWYDETMKVGFYSFLRTILTWKSNGYDEEGANHIANHTHLNDGMMRFCQYSQNETNIPWRDLEFRDKFLGIRKVAKARLGQIHRLELHRRELINIAVRYLADRKPVDLKLTDADWEDYRVSAVLHNLGSSFKGKWKHFRNVFKRRTEADMAKLHELELTFDYSMPHKNLTVWTDRIQLGRTALVQSTAMLGIVLAIHEGKTDKLFSLIHTVFGNTKEDDSPHMVVSGITGNTKAKMREYRGGWEEAFMIRYTQELNVGGKKK